MAPHARDKCETNKTGGVIDEILYASNQLYAGISGESDGTRKSKNPFGADN